MYTHQGRCYWHLIFFICFFTLSLLSANLFSQDSLLKKIGLFEQKNQVHAQLSKSDTVYLNNLVKLSRIYLVNNDYQNAIKFSNIAIKIGHELKVSNHNAKLYAFLGSAYDGIGDFNIALTFYKAAIKQYFKDGNRKDAAYMFFNICSTYNSSGKYSLAIDALYTALKIFESINDPYGKALVNFTMGNIYSDMLSDKQEALSYYHKSLNYFLVIKSLSNIGQLYNCIGVTYCDLANYPLALKYLYSAMNINLQLENKSELASIYNSLGGVYFKMGNNEKALDNYSKSKAIFEELGDYEGEAYSNLDIGELFLKQGNTNYANSCLIKALKISIDIGAKQYLMPIYQYLTEIDSMNHNWQSAYIHHKLYIQYRDSLQNEENTKKLVQTQMQYDFDKKQAADSIKVSAEKKVLGARIQQQKTQRNAFIAGFALVLILAGFIFRSYKQKQKANLLLEEKNIAILSQKEVIEEQKKTVEVKQKQIMSSITYAKRIQQSILMPEQDIKKHLPESFVLYLPKDIVSGDFYWFSQQGQDSIVVCADCTGHGVPGAFLSMVGSTLLNEIVQHKKITDPAHILKELAKGVSSTLSNKAIEQSTSDGMDISICKINPEKICFAAANNSIYLTTQNGLQEIEPQVNSINGIFELHSEQPVQSIELHPTQGTMLYLSTDGFADQPGESTKKKLFSTGFEKILTDIQHLRADEQKQALEKFFYQWKGNLKQHDDILVMGIRV